jgi:hypothetical protein
MHKIHALIAALLIATITASHAQYAPCDAKPRPLSICDTTVSYGKRLSDAVKFNLIDPGGVEAESMVEVELSVAKDGTIQSYKVLHTEGSPAWHTAVMRAIMKSDKLPLDVDGTVPSNVLIVFRP